MEINQHGISYQFYCKDYENGKKFVFSTSIKSIYLPRIGEEVYYDFLEERGEQIGVSLETVGIVIKVSHQLITLPETFDKKKPKRIQNYVLVDIVVKSK